MSRTYKDARALKVSRKQNDELKAVTPYKRSNSHRLTAVAKTYNGNR
jgi:hypothetical protein